LLQNARVIRKKLLDAIPEPTERQRIGNEIKAAMIFARADLINVEVIFCETLLQGSQSSIAVPAKSATMRLETRQSIGANQ
jgi:hypothetical protein